MLNFLPLMFFLIKAATRNFHMVDSGHPYDAQYLYISDNLQWNGCKIQGVHYKVHQVPPVIYVVFEATIPHLFDLGPYKALEKLTNNRG